MVVICDSFIYLYSFNWIKFHVQIDKRNLIIFDLMINFNLILQGIVASGLVVIVTSWCIKMRGPLFASVFNPLMLLFVTIVASMTLDENLYLGRYVYILT
jgi:hypothetical protein